MPCNLYNQSYCLHHTDDILSPIVVIDIHLFYDLMYVWSSVFTLHCYCKSYRKPDVSLQVSLFLTHYSDVLLGPHIEHLQYRCQ